MRFIKAGLIGVLIFFLVLMGLSLLLPSTQRISRAINMGIPPKKIIRVAEDLHNWDQWNGFIINSGLRHIEIMPPPPGEGRYLHADQLSLSIRLQGSDSILMHWRQTPGRSFDGGMRCLQLSSDSVTVQWWFDFHFRWYPWEKLSSLVYDQQMGPIMEESLTRLKHLLENSP